MVLVFFFFLGHVRSAIIVTVTLIVTPLVAFIVMERLGLSANLMTLGGLAIAIGEIADGSLVVVENVYRHLGNHRAGQQTSLEVILQATKEVGRPILFGILIISVVFLPLMTLHGMEGKMFAPLAYTLVIALLTSVVVTLTLSPVLASVVAESSARRNAGDPLDEAGVFAGATLDAPLSCTSLSARRSWCWQACFSCPVSGVNLSPYWKKAR